jgi:hypothetical protein
MRKGGRKECEKVRKEGWGGERGKDYVRGRKELMWGGKKYGIAADVVVQ